MRITLGNSSAYILALLISGMRRAIQSGEDRINPESPIETRVRDQDLNFADEQIKERE